MQSVFARGHSASDSCAVTFMQITQSLFSYSDCKSAVYLRIKIIPIVTCSEFPFGNWDFKMVISCLPCPEPRQQNEHPSWPLEHVQALSKPAITWFYFALTRPQWQFLQNCSRFTKKTVVGYPLCHDKGIRKYCALVFLHISEF